MTNYHVGDRVWIATYNSSALQVKECPVCFGKKQVTLILGNGDSLTVPCDYCAKGFDEPRGYVKEYVAEATAELMTITAIHTTEDGQGTHHEYHSGSKNSYLVLTPDRMFTTEAEAVAKGAELAAAARAAEDERAEYLKEKAHKSFSWNAGYHMREAKRAREEAERHEKKAVLCKARATTD